MADPEFYKLSMSGAEADSGIRTGMEAGAAGGVLFSDGNGSIRAATPGTDFGYPLLKDYGVPTNNTAANIGQHYFDMSATAFPYEYICVGYTASGFVWKVYGDTGDNFIILGYFATLEDLENAITDGIVDAPTAGAAYGIGTAAPYDIYVWDGVNETWVNNGPIGSSGGSSVPPHGTTGQPLIKLSDADGDVGWGQLPAEGMADGSVTTPKLADGSVTIPKIDPAAIDAEPTQDSNNLVSSGGVATAIANAGTPFNYAHNADFTQWVAQAGIGGSHGNQAYGGDRWILDSGTITGDARADGNGYENITLNGTIRQIVANPPATGTVGVDMISGTATASYANGEITITSSGGVPKDVWLYEGAYEAGAAPKFQPKGYGVELAECQRYAVFYGQYDQWLITAVNSLYMDAAVYLPCTMRIKPSVLNGQNFVVITPNGSASGFTASVPVAHNNVLRLRLEKSGHGLSAQPTINAEATGVVAFIADPE